MSRPREIVPMNFRVVVVGWDMVVFGMFGVGEVGGERDGMGFGRWWEMGKVECR